MPKNLSAIKRVDLSARNRLYNKKYKSAIKRSIKKYLLSIKDFNKSIIDFQQVSDKLSIVYQKIDKAIVKGVIHKNTGSRKKAKLAKYIKQN